MPETFSYKVRDKAGKLVEGQLEAENAQLVVSKLRSMGYVPIEIEQQGGNSLGRDIKIPFHIAPYHRELLLQGLDPISRTLREESRIRDYEARRAS